MATCTKCNLAVGVEGATCAGCYTRGLEQTVATQAEEIEAAQNHTDWVEKAATKTLIERDKAWAVVKEQAEEIGKWKEFAQALDVLNSRYRTNSLGNRDIGRVVDRARAARTAVAALAPPTEGE